MIEIQEKTLAEQLVELLSKTGLPFAEDGWENKAPDDYGVVEVTGEETGEWADGHMIDESFAAVITIYVTGNSARWVDRIQRILEAIDAGYSMPERKYLPDIKKVSWKWKANLYSPIEWPEAVEV